MEKEVKLFDKRFVYFMWDDELKGKECFVADNIDNLIFAVKNDGKCGVKTNGLQPSSRASLPFLDSILNNCYPFAYHDPNYEVKKAFNEGKKVQYRLVGGVDWADLENEVDLDFAIENERAFRIKPDEDERWVVYLRRSESGEGIYLTSCEEKDWEEVKERYNAKTKLFVGSYDEAIKRYESRRKFIKVIEAWEDGKTIQVYETLFKKWGDCAGTLEWYTDCEYRVKPEEKQYHPYESSAEMIVDFIDRFKVKCPSYCEPLIWLSLKEDERNRFLVTGFHEDSIEITKQPAPMNMSCVFEKFVYLDGSPVGMEC